MSGITRHGKRVRFYSTVDLVNALEREKAEGRAGEVLVLLYLTSSMLDARFDPNVGVRRFNEHGSYVKRR